MADVFSFIISGDARETSGRCNKAGQCQDIALVCILHTLHILKKTSFILTETTEVFPY